MPDLSRAIFCLGLIACTGHTAPPDSAATSASDPVASAEVWGAVYDGSDPTVPFLPDQNVRYWRYALDEIPDGTALRIQGSLLGVRYQAVDVYDDTTRTSTGALRDVEMGDPFELFVSAEEIPGAQVMAAPDGPAAIFLRLYDPEGLVDAPALPVVSLVDVETGEELPPPAAQEPLDIPQGLLDLVLKKRQIKPRGDRVDFYRVDDSGLYAAYDNQYLVAQVEREPGGVVLVRFQPPTWADEAGASADVRYWSFTQCDRHSYCHHTIADHEIGHGTDPIELVFADDEPALRAAAGDRIFVPWSTPDDELLLLYRNLVTAEGFEGAIAQVPYFDGGEPAEGQEAPTVLGAHAPSGRQCSRDAFIAGTCGL